MAEWQQPPQQGWGGNQNQWGAADASGPFQNAPAWQQQQQWSASAPGWSGTAPSTQSVQQPTTQFQQVQQRHAPQSWQPNFDNLGLDPMLNVGLQAGAHLVQEHAEKAAKQYMPGVTSFWGSLRKYFQVNNTFVIKKLYAIFFPFVKKDWTRTPTNEPPANDQNSPDLYIPLMALSTYVLTVGLAKGSSMTFNPEVIVDTFGTSVMVQLVQIVLIRIAQITLVPWVTALPWLELVAYTGYLFTGVAVNMLVGFFFGHTLYNICLLWTATSAAFAIYQTMRAVIPPPEPGQRGKRRRVNFFIVVAVLQVFVMWFLGYTRELRSGGVFSITKDGIDSIIPPANGGNGYAIPPDAREDIQHIQKPGRNDRYVRDDSDDMPEQPVRTGKRGRRQQQPVSDGTDV